MQFSVFYNTKTNITFEGLMSYSEFLKFMRKLEDISDTVFTVA